MRRKTRQEGRCGGGVSAGFGGYDEGVGCGIADTVLERDLDAIFKSSSRRQYSSLATSLRTFLTSESPKEKDKIEKKEKKLPTVLYFNLKILCL